MTRRMTSKDSNGSTVISLKWVVTLLVGALLSVVGGFAAQRYSVETRIWDRIITLEMNQAQIMERLQSNSKILEANSKTLEKVYAELKDHRITGK